MFRYLAAQCLEHGQSSFSFSGRTTIAWQFVVLDSAALLSPTPHIIRIHGVARSNPQVIVTTKKNIIPCFQIFLVENYICKNCGLEGTGIDIR